MLQAPVSGSFYSAFVGYHGMDVTAAGRRAFLKALGGGAAGLVLGRHALAAPAPAAGLALQPLTDNLTLVSGAGGNVVALGSPDGMLLVDCGAPEHTPALLAALAGLPGGRRITQVFNTHWHWDHTGANERLHQAGASILAHENTRLWLGTTVWEEWQNRSYPPRPRSALPDKTVYTSGSLTFAGEPVEYGYLAQAHTDGDLYVHLRRANVLVAGDVVSVGRYPLSDYSTGGWIGGMVDATQKLIDLSDDKTRIVPGTGPVQRRADLIAAHDMLASLKESLWQLMRKGMNADDWIAMDVTREYDAKWGNPQLFLNTTYRGLYAHVREMRGVV